MSTSASRSSSTATLMKKSCLQLMQRPRTASYSRQQLKSGTISISTQRWWTDASTTWTGTFWRTIICRRLVLNAWIFSSKSFSSRFRRPSARQFWSRSQLRGMAILSIVKQLKVQSNFIQTSAWWSLSLWRHAIQSSCGKVIAIWPCTRGILSMASSSTPSKSIRPRLLIGCNLGVAPSTWLRSQRLSDEKRAMQITGCSLRPRARCSRLSKAS